MKIRYDSEANALYIRFREGEVAESDELKNGVIVDYDAEGKPIAVEVLDASDILANNPEVVVDLGKKKIAV